MNLLLDLCPSTVEVDGLKIPIQTDFRASILFELAMQDKELSDEEKMGTALDIYFPDIEIHDIKTASEQIIWFYSCGKEKKEGSSASRTKEIYSFEYDDEYIYSAFLEQYKIDLNTDILHWWKFKALFRGLKEDCMMSKIMGYRAIDISSDMGKEEQKHYRKMKELYALPDMRTKEEKENDFVNSIGGLF